MDRIVWLIVLTVVANFILEFSGVLAQTKDSRSYGPPAASYQHPSAARNAINPDDVELVDPMVASPSDNGRSSRIKLFDNIFRVNIRPLNRGSFNRTHTHTHTHSNH